MKNFIALVSFVSTAAFANDGGMAAIKVDSIKMRETKVVDGSEIIVKKIINPSYKIIIEGGEAAKLQKVLPSTGSVITSMYPSIKKDYDESFKALGISSNKTAEASSKVVIIECSDAKLSAVTDTDMKVIKTGKSVCTITINAVDEGMDAADYFGDAQPFEPKMCK